MENRNGIILFHQIAAFYRAVRNDDMDELPRLNVLMNGPRVIWGRMPSLALSLFILFKEPLDSDDAVAVQIPGSISYIVDKMVNH